jgi:hypothetical protein
VGDAVSGYAVVDFATGLTGARCGFAVLLPVVIAESGVVWSAESDICSGDKCRCTSWKLRMIYLLLIDDNVPAGFMVSSSALYIHLLRCVGFLLGMLWSKIGRHFCIVSS